MLQKAKAKSLQKYSRKTAVTGVPTQIYLVWTLDYNKQANKFQNLQK
jgi:hypothetical protein